MRELEFFRRAKAHGTRVALKTDASEHRYDDLLNRSAEIASRLTGDSLDLEEARIAFLVLPGFDYVATQWAIWRAGGVAVPLSLSATESELEYVLSDSQSAVVITSHEFCDRFASFDCEIYFVEEIESKVTTALPEVSPDRKGMILYTSGTTSKPKGVVATHANIQAQIESLVEAWEWTGDDRIPLFLPLHHIHGIINVCGCALWSGALIEPFAHFDIDSVTSRVRDGAYTLFMAVPTIYVKLIEAMETLDVDSRMELVESFSKLRLMISGSAALPVSVHETWEQLTGQRLLERYGMTEIGMALSNPVSGERRPGAVGQPLPYVNVRLKSEQGDIVETEGQPGEIQVRGPAVFNEYWNKPEITEQSFDEGWFCSGDMAVVESGYYRIMGRISVDIIKSGGYKLSALEIEAVLLQHCDIAECAVVGVNDDTWGELVAAAVVVRNGTELDIDELRNWCRDKMSTYKIPKRLITTKALPRNAMGKVTKPLVGKMFT